MHQWCAWKLAADALKNPLLCHGFPSTLIDMLQSSVWVWLPEHCFQFKYLAWGVRISVSCFFN